MSNQIFVFLTTISLMLIETAFTQQVQSPNWIWISGSNRTYQYGIYGTKGIASSSSIPGARYYPISWKDSSDNLWLFGGLGFAATGSEGRLNDLWKYDGMNWTWISGSNSADQNGNYGTKGIASSSNIPGARQSAASWIDSENVFWLFGGNGYPATGNFGYLNDLWKFNGTHWTWISGSNLINQYGTYGTKGIASSSNVPGARYSAVSWKDSNNFWLFGGLGYAATGSAASLNDLWKFNGTHWTWISGSNVTNQYGTYGTKGIPSSSNVPGARYSAVSWTDSNNIWIFGGLGYAATGGEGDLNDLWKFDGMNWTWISGSNLINQRGTYGTKGIANSSNIPGGRRYALSWIDSNDDLWLFGGSGYASATGIFGFLNDLWKFNGMNWTWISGSNSADQYGNYGTKGIASSSNVPGARRGALSWIDSNDDLWLFGGLGLANDYGILNDLWKYEFPRPITSGPLTSDSLTDSLTSGSLTSDSLTSGSLTSDSLTSDSLTSGPLTSDSLTSASLTSDSLTDSLTSGSLTSGPLTSDSLTASTISTTTTTDTVESRTSTIRITSIILIIVGILMLIV